MPKIHYTRFLVARWQQVVVMEFGRRHDTTYGLATGKWVEWILAYTPIGLYTLLCMVLSSRFVVNIIFINFHVLAELSSATDEKDMLILFINSLIHKIVNLVLLNPYMS